MEFLDTNVLVYAASQTAADQQKAGVARGLLRRGPNEFAVSVAKPCILKISMTVRTMTVCAWKTPFADS